MDISSIFLAISPVIVSAIMAGIKSVPQVADLDTTGKRAVLAVIALVYAMLNVWLSGDSSAVAPAVQVCIEAFLAVVGAHGVYNLATTESK
jgi:hypothetical protein